MFVTVKANADGEPTLYSEFTDDVIDTSILLPDEKKAFEALASLLITNPSERYAFDISIPETVDVKRTDLSK